MMTMIMVMMLIIRLMMIMMPMMEVQSSVMLVSMALNIKTKAPVVIVLFAIFCCFCDLRVNFKIPLLAEQCLHLIP